MTKYSNYKDYANRIKKKEIQKKLLILKSFLLNEKNSKKIRFKIMLILTRNKLTLGSNKIINRCMYSTKIRSVSRITNLTKSSFRDNIRWGLINGFKKSSW